MKNDFGFRIWEFEFRLRVFRGLAANSTFDIRNPKSEIRNRFILHPYFAGILARP